jgi:serine protease AprX
LIADGKSDVLAERSKIKMKRTACITTLAIVIVGLWVSFGFGAQEDGGHVHVILQAEDTTDALVAHIKSLGGIIKFQYRNVPAVAAAIPADQISAVAGFSGVTRVEKDRTMKLHDRPFSGNDAIPLSFFPIEDLDVEPVDPETIDPDDLPRCYGSYLHTGALKVWDETEMGNGTIVAVVDTGVVPNLCLGHAVIGAEGFPDGYNATDDGYAATDPINHFHGTHMGSVIASSCMLDFSDGEGHPLYQAFSTYWPSDKGFIPILGQAPKARLYPVKVFRYDEEDTPTSVILDGLDHILTLKKSGELDIDIVNMSLGGPTVFDGRDAFDRFVLELWKVKILVVASAGNSGPLPNTVGSPATGFNTIAVGGLDYANSSRFYYEYIGLLFGISGQGSVMRPSDETRVVNFSSRGPLSGGRAGPDISALATWSFHSWPNNTFSWELGTSPAGATVSGGAALLNAYWENITGKETSPAILRRVLMGGANKDEVGPAWQSINDQGWGTLDVSASLNLLKDGNWEFPVFEFIGRLMPNILPWPLRGSTDIFESGTITLGASEKADFVFQVNLLTSLVTVEVFDIDIPDNSADAFMPNMLEINMQSAQRSETPRPLRERWWFPWDGDAFTITVEDGPWTLTSALVSEPLADRPMEPGLMKVTLLGGISNECPVSFKIRVTREGFGEPLMQPIATQTIQIDDVFQIPVEIPTDVTKATFDLRWFRDWRRFPTSDIDMLIFSPGGELVSVDGATYNAPERAVIDSPIPGIWYVLVYGYEMYKDDRFRLYLTTE